MKRIKLSLIFQVLIFLSWVIPTTGQVIPGIKSGKYLQEIKTEIELPKQAATPVLKLFTDQKQITAVMANGVYRKIGDVWTGEPFGTGWRTATLDTKSSVWLASAHTIQQEGVSKQLELPEYAKNDTILCLFWENEKTLQVGTTNGLLTYDGNWAIVPMSTGKRVNSILKDAKEDLWLATNDGLLRRMAGKWVNLDDDLMAYGLKRTYFALESGKTKADVLFGGLFSVGCIAEDGNHWLLRGADGLPYGPVTTIRKSGETMWFGTDRGAIKKDNS